MPLRDAPFKGSPFKGSFRPGSLGVLVRLSHVDTARDDRLRGCLGCGGIWGVSGDLGGLGLGIWAVQEGHWG